MRRCQEGQVCRVDNNILRIISIVSSKTLSIKWLVFATSGSYHIYSGHLVTGRKIKGKRFLFQTGVTYS